MGDHVGLGIVGLGRWSNAHAAAAHRSENVAIVNCFARTAERRSAFAAEHGVPNTADSFEHLVADPRVQGLIVSTPNDLHVSQVRTAVEAGKPVLVDKPAAVDLAEGLELLRVVDVAGVPVGVAHHARRLAGHRAAKGWIESGEAGDVRLAYGDFSNNRAAAMKPDAWHRSVQGSDGGVLIQVGIHQVDVMLYLLGPALMVNARFGFDVLGAEMPDVAAVIMSHVGGALSAVTTSWTTPSHYRTEVQATGGNLSFRLDHGHWPNGDVDEYGELELDPAEGERGPYPIEAGDPLRDQLDDLGRSVREGTPMAVDLIAGLRAVAVVESAVASARDDGAPVSIEELIRNSGGTEDELVRLLSL